MSFHQTRDGLNRVVLLRYVLQVRPPHFQLPRSKPHHVDTNTQSQCCVANEFVELVRRPKSLEPMPEVFNFSLAVVMGAQHIRDCLLTLTDDFDEELA